MVSKIKQFINTHQEDIILVISVILISLLSFAIGYLVAKYQQKEPLRFEETGFIILTLCHHETCDGSRGVVYELHGYKSE